MTIRSYLILVSPGHREPAAESLRAMPGCEVLPAENRDVIVVVSETPDREGDDELEHRLSAVPGVVAVSLVAGYAEA